MFSDQDKDASWKVTVVKCKFFGSEWVCFVKSSSWLWFGAADDIVTALDDILPWDSPKIHNVFQVDFIFLKSYCTQSACFQNSILGPPLKVPAPCRCAFIPLFFPSWPFLVDVVFNFVQRKGTRVKLAEMLADLELLFTQRLYKHASCGSAFFFFSFNMSVFPGMVMVSGAHQPDW